MLNRIQALVLAAALALAPNAYAGGGSFGQAETLGAKLRHASEAAARTNRLINPRLLGSTQWHLLTGAAWPATSTVIATGDLYYSTTAGQVYRAVFPGTVANGALQPTSANNFTGTYYQGAGETVIWQYAGYVAPSAGQSGSYISNNGLVYQITACSAACQPATIAGGPIGGGNGITDGNITWSYIGVQTAPTVTISPAHDTTLSNWYFANPTGLVKGTILTDTTAAAIGNVGPFQYGGGYPVAAAPASGTGPGPVNFAGAVRAQGSQNCGGWASLNGNTGNGAYTAISSMSWAASVVTLSTVTNLTPQVGQNVTIQGEPTAGYNGTFPMVTGTTGTTIKYAVVSNPGAVGGISAATANPTWDSGNGGELPLVFASATQATQVGQPLYINGLTNGGSGGTGLVNNYFNIIAFTDSQHFTVGMPGTGVTIGSVTGTPNVSFDTVPYAAMQCVHGRTTFTATANKIEIALNTNTAFNLRVDGRDLDNTYLYTTYGGTGINPVSWNVGANDITLDFTNAGGRAQHDIEVVANAGASFEVVAVGPADSVSYPTITANSIYYVEAGTSLSTGSNCFNLANCWYNDLAVLMGWKSDTSLGVGGTGVIIPPDFESHNFYDLANQVAFHVPDVFGFDCCTNDVGVNAVNVNVVNGKPDVWVTQASGLSIPYWVTAMTVTIAGTGVTFTGHPDQNGRHITLSSNWAGSTSQAASLSYTITDAAIKSALLNNVTGTYADGTCQIQNAPPNGCGYLPNVRKVLGNAALILGFGSPVSSQAVITGTGTLAGTTFTATAAAFNTTYKNAIKEIDINGCVVPVTAVSSTTILTIQSTAGVNGSGACTAAATAQAYRAPMNAYLTPNTISGNTAAEVTFSQAMAYWNSVDPAGVYGSAYIPYQIVVPPNNPPVMGSGYQAASTGPCSLAGVSAANGNASSLAGTAALGASANSVHLTDCGGLMAAQGFLPYVQAAIKALP